MATKYTPFAFQEPEVRMVLVGKTGIGKSAAGNTILGEKVFKSEPSLSSITSECEKKSGHFAGQKLAVVDTPGLFDTRKTNREILTEIGKCISMAAPGPHVFLVIVQLTRFTKEEEDTVKIIQTWFGKDASKYTMVLFTHGDQLKKLKTEDPMKNLIQQNEALSAFTAQCQGGYHVFDNDNEDPAQVRELLQKINKMVEQNGGSFYTDKMFTEADEANREEMKKLLKENPNMSPEEAKQKAEKDNSFIRRFLMGAGAGAAVGAGVGAAVGAAAGPLGAGAGAGAGAALEPEPEAVLRLVLVGQERVGKSSAGNTILGKKAFDCQVSSSTVTLNSQKVDGEVLGRRVSVVDTPGFCCSGLSAEEIKEELQKAVEMSSPGPHVFLLVLQLGRLSPQEQRAMKTLQEMLGPDVSKHTMILFTYGDLLKATKTDLDRFVREDQNLQKLLQSCSGKYHLFNNNEESREQVQELLEKIDQFSCGGRVYYKQGPQPGWFVRFLSNVYRILHSLFDYLSQMLRSRRNRD